MSHSRYAYVIRLNRPEILTEGPTPDESSALDEHFAYASDLTTRGIVQMAGRTLTTGETGFGIIIFTAESEEEAVQIMNNDPAVVHHVMRAELFPFRIALLSETIRSD